MKDKIYITGHRHPDSDSVISAIAYALLKQKKGIHAIACRLGELNLETKYLLDRFGFEPPLLLEDARATLGDIDLDTPLTLSPETTIHEALDRMIADHRQTYGVVNEKGQLLGLVSKSDIADIGLGDTAFGIALLKETSIENMCKTLNGKLVYTDSQLHFNGKVSIIAMTEKRLTFYDIKDRLVILGDDEKAQISAIKKGAAILIVVWADSVSEKVQKLAEEEHCPIIISGYGAMNTTRYLYFSPSVKLVMNRHVVHFNENEFVEDAGKKMLKTRYHSYPVVDDEYVVKGYVSRFHILNAKNKKIILVDHNEYSQSVKGIEKAELLEVIDHHRVCDIFTSRPILFRNEIIGSTASIITSMYLENQIEISKDVAGILLGAILSDTLKFRSPTTTEKDIQMANILAKIAEIDVDSFAKEMFKVSSNIHNRSVKSLIQGDIKKFEMDHFKVMISQVIVSSVSEVKEIESSLQEELDSFTSAKGLDLCVVAFTSILENGSIFYAAGNQSKIVLEAFPNKAGEEHSFLEDVVSRKNQIVPILSKTMMNSLT